jgi:hypothetical protein
MVWLEGGTEIIAIIIIIIIKLVLTDVFTTQLHV